MMKNQLKHWHIWLIVAIAFLVVVQILFTIPAPCKWLDAVWEAGDLITFVGTIALGFIAVRQTQYANEIAKTASDSATEANETSRKLIEMQKAEYLPTIIVDGFAGITKHQISDVKTEIKSELVMHEMRTKDNEVMLGYSIALPDDNLNLHDKTFCRDYEFHFKYKGHFVIKNVVLISISYKGVEFEKNYNIDASLNSSLDNEQDFRFFVFLVSNQDYLDQTKAAHQYIKATQIDLVFEMETMQDTVYRQTVTIRKHLVMQPEKVFNTEKVELPVSASYSIAEVVRG